MSGTTDPIDAAARKAARARERLLTLMAEACPGPHEFVQHRDNRSPWCRACRRDAGGRRVER